MEERPVVEVAVLGRQRSECTLACECSCNDHRPLRRKEANVRKMSEEQTPHEGDTSGRIGLGCTFSVLETA